MTALTVESAEQQLKALADTLIQKLREQHAPKLITIPEIALQPGERYAGAVLDAEGRVKHHLVLLPNKPDGRLTWEDAKAWAKRIGGFLPDRQEQALLFANCKPHLDADWHWSSEEHTNASFAWTCDFTYGDQHYDHKSAEGCAVAVRRA